MKRYFKGLYMSFGMFCAIPLPFHIWDDASMNLILPFFPVVGGIIGLLWWVCAELLISAGIHTMPAAAALALLPFILTGFLHLDGYMDTSDAVLSRRPLEDKLRILKDPHTGAFAVIMLAALFLFQFSAAYAALENAERSVLFLLISIPVLSRTLSALSIILLEAIPQSGYANMFKKNINTSHKIFLFSVFIIAAASFYFIAGSGGLIVLAFSIAGFTGAIAYAYKNLNGISGDLAGYALVICELCGFTALSLL